MSEISAIKNTNQFGVELFSYWPETEWALAFLKDLNKTAKESPNRVGYETGDLFLQMKSQDSEFLDNLKYLDFDTFVNQIGDLHPDTTANERKDGVSTKYQYQLPISNDCLLEARKLWYEFESDRLAFWNKLSELEQWVLYDFYIWCRQVIWPNIIYLLFFSLGRERRKKE